MTPDPKKDLPLGAHMSIAGGIPLSVGRLLEVGGRALQIFVKNNNQWSWRTVGEEEASRFRLEVRSSGLSDVAAHSSYLINLASPDEALWRRSIAAMVDELERCRALGISALVTHPGAHREAGESAGIGRIAQALDRILEEFPSPAVHIALETTAGQGTSVGHRFEHLRDIMGLCRYTDRVVVCLDTCHIFAAGYDLRSPQAYAATMAGFDRTVGIERLRLLHLNDSRRELGSRVDRHQHIGKGEIGRTGFACLMRDPRLAHIPKVLETPKGKDGAEDRHNLRLLEELAHETDSNPIGTPANQRRNRPAPAQDS